MDNGKRLDALERDFGRIIMQLSAINATLQSMTKLSNPTSPPSTQITGTMMANDTLNAGSKLKPAPPSDFDGDRTKGRAFLNSCELYIRLSPDRFPNELAKVYWAFTYMKSDRAYAFADRAIRHEGKMGYPRFPTWTAFRTDFIREFFPWNEAQRAITCLETTTYFQGERSVDEYIDKFKDLIDLSGYMDGLIVVVKFR